VGQAEKDEQHQHQRRQRAEHVHIDDDQRVDRAEAEAAHDREHEAEDKAGDDHQHRDLYGHEHRLENVRPVARDDLGLEEAVDEDRAVHYRPISLTKARVRAPASEPKMKAGGPCSTIAPSSRNTTRSAASRAKRISWLTTTIVMPEPRRSRI